MSRQPIRSVIISDCDPRSQLFAHLLAQRAQDLTLLRISYSESAKNKSVTDAESVLRERLAEKLRLFLQRVRRYWCSKIIARSYGRLNLPRTTIIPASEFASEQGHIVLSQLAPDIIFTCGAPLLKSNLFGLARIAAVNFHFGIAPQYRGNDTVFWTLLNGEFDLLGGTVHKIDKGVDTGEILGRVYPELAPGETELGLDLKIAEMMAELAAEIIQAAEQGKRIGGVSQDGSGRNFKSKERTPWMDASYVGKRLLGKIKVLSRKAKVERFF